MIIGDPDKFAIIYDIVFNWNSDWTFKNGTLFFVINSTVFPQKIQPSALSDDIPELKHKLRKIPDNKIIYDMDSKSAFSELYNNYIKILNDHYADNDYDYLISPSSFINNNCYVFAVGNGDNIRILASKKIYNKESDSHLISDDEIAETIFSKGDLR